MRAGANRGGLGDRMSLNVVIADSSRADRTRARIALEPHDCSVTEATNGDVVPRLAREVHADVVLLEIDMPVDGYHAIEALKQDPRTADIAVAVLTNRTDGESIHRSLDLGAIGFLTKPVFASRLYDQVHAIVRRAKESPDEKLVDYSKTF